MSTIEEFKNAPAGATARIPGVSNVMVKGDPELPRPWTDLISTVYTDQEVADLGYVLDPAPTAPTSAREALDLAWELAHPVKEGQVLPANTETISISDVSLHMTSEGWDKVVEPGLVGILRTLEPLPEPEPEWLEAPAVMATCTGCDEEEPGFTVHICMYAGDWRCVECSHTTQWRNLRDVTPLYPKEQAACQAAIGDKP